jgi:hypothetical protein
MRPSLAENYARFLSNLRRYGEAKALLRKTIPVARRVLGENNDLTLKMRWTYAWALYKSGGPPARPWAATLDVIREAVTTLTEIEQTARRVLGGGHPMAREIARGLKFALRDLRKAVETLAETERTTRRVLGSAHPVTVGIEVELRDARATLAASETPPPRGA